MWVTSMERVVQQELDKLRKWGAIDRVLAHHARAHRGECEYAREREYLACDFCDGGVFDSAFYLLTTYRRSQFGDGYDDELAKVPSIALTPLRVSLAPFPVWRFSYDLRRDCSDMIYPHLKELGIKAAAAIRLYSDEHEQAKRLALILADRETVSSCTANVYAKRLHKAEKLLCAPHIKPAAQ